MRDQNDVPSILPYEVDGKVRCNQCDGRGCRHCGGQGYHIKIDDEPAKPRRDRPRHPRGL